MISRETESCKYTEDHSYQGNKIRCEGFATDVGIGWQFVLNDCIRGENMLRTAQDAWSDAVDLLIMLQYCEPGMDSERFSTYLKARARLEPGFDWKLASAV